MNARNPRANVIPAMRYDDAPAAIEWLCSAFGFEKLLVVPGEHGTVAHAQLVFGNGMIMLGSATEGDFGRFVKPPRDLGGLESQSPYIIVPDADEHYARAVAAGAEIVMDIKDEDYGGRGYSCRDPEGHLWNFGTYDPWAVAPAPAPAGLDHMILYVNDRAKSIDFYTRILGFEYEGEREPFSSVRVTPDLTLQLAPWGTQGGEHLAFAMSRAEFDQVFRRVREAGVAYGDTFDAVGNMRGPGESAGTHGLGAALYLHDPSKHLIEIRHYER